MSRNQGSRSVRTRNQNAASTMDGSSDEEIISYPSLVGSDEVNTLELDNNISRSSSSNSNEDPPQHRRIDNSASQIIPDSAFDALLLEDETKNIPARNLVAVNVPERIVLCVDITEEPDATAFKFGDGTLLSPLSMIKRIVEIFMFGKSSINKNHEFALVVLKGNQSLWMTPFTKDPHPINRDLKELTAPDCSAFDMSMLFDVLKEFMPLPTQIGGEVPDFVPRVIVIYSRSSCIPQFATGRDSFNSLLQCPFITLDALYIHEDPSEENKCKEIFNELMELDHVGYSYIFHAVRNPKLVHDCMAKLLAHPLQRPIQKKTSYKFEPVANDLPSQSK